MDNLRSWFKQNGFNTVKEGSAQLTEELGISVKEYEEENLFVLNYSQIDSPKTHPVVLECRGLIVDNDLNPICRPFDRFFNIGEALDITGDFNFNDAEFFEKADGSLVKVYHYKDKWHIATRGTAFAESDNYTGESFESLILKAFGCTDMDDFQDKMTTTPKGFTHVFEYTSPSNRVVTPYTEDKMVLLGIRHTATGEDLGDTEALTMAAACFANTRGMNVRAAKSYSFKSKEELLKAVQELPGLQEGFVCYDKGKRIKVKSELYVQVHKLRGDTLPTPKRIAGLVVTNEYDEYLAYFPEEQERFQPYIDAFTGMVKEANELLEATAAIEDQKEFALTVKDKIYAPGVFAARKRNSSFLEEFSKLLLPGRIRTLLTYKEVME